MAEGLFRWEEDAPAEVIASVSDTPLLSTTSVVIAGPRIKSEGDPAIHSVTVVNAKSATEWMPWSSHGMTTVL
jgi:hypothetical protein